MIAMAWYDSYSGGGRGIGSFLDVLAQNGFFSYLLPFLLIFALINGILGKTQLFKDNKSVNAIIALVVGLLALQFEMVPIFFSEIFPRLGIGLAVILVLLILVGMFSDPDNKGIMWVFFGIGAIILIVILVQTAGSLGWSSAYWWYDNWKMIAGLVFFLILFAVAAGAGGGGKDSNSPLARALRGKD